MDLILSARTIDASEAERIGLISRVVPAARLREEAILLAAEIAKYPLQALMASKEAINRSFETSLSEGILFERRSFHALFGTADQKEGMAAFLEKREPTFKNC
jgi:enoyl-CoA hydratase